MNISDHKETAGKTNPEKLKNRIRESLRKSPEKTAKRVKQAGTQSRRAREYAGILSRMVQYDTTSHPYSDAHPAAVQLERYHGYHRLLEVLFPLVHEMLEKTDLEGSLLYCWKGKNHERPIVLMGHQDVVPVTDAEWKYPPFSGMGHRRAFESKKSVIIKKDFVPCFTKTMLLYFLCAQALSCLFVCKIRETV